ncbi:hypothetical protein WJX72_011007 [[Myrmecia] bisecta]|uniref:Cilium assembly protein DZIP1 N-terminal domain-containing protein n=1 Tax=[Myrmecia] bisecta TaxID=41462 RepID=A0AAW1Q1Y8_9CHLO
MEMRGDHTPVDTPGRTVLKLGVRHGRFDWQLLHGLDADEVVAQADAVAVETVVDTLLRGDVAAEELSDHNYLQAARLLQLTVEYVWHLQDSYELYCQQLVQCQQAVDTYTDALWRFADQALAEQQAIAAHADQLSALASATDQARRKLRPRRIALEQLQAKLSAIESKQGCFRFHIRHAHLDWALLHSVDVQAVKCGADLSSLLRTMPCATFGHLLHPTPAPLTARNWVQLINVLQLALDFVLHCLQTAHDRQARLNLSLMRSGPAAAGPACLADGISSVLREEHKQTQQLQLQMSDVWSQMSRLQARHGAEPVADAAPLTSETCCEPPTANIELDVEGLRAEVRRGCEARLRWQVQEIKRRAFSDLQRRVSADLERQSVNEHPQ